MLNLTQLHLSSTNLAQKLDQETCELVVQADGSEDLYPEVGSDLGLAEVELVEPEDDPMLLRLCLNYLKVCGSCL
jgi:hypothetical protein